MEDQHKNSSKTAIETDYSAHQENPGPSKEAVEEKDDRSVGNTIKWVIAIAVLILVIAYFIFT